MLKRPIKYKNFDDEEVTEDFYFNLSAPEMHELDSHYPNGYGQYLELAMKQENNEALFAAFKDMILMSYGEKSADGKLFIKKDPDGRDLSAMFVQSAAYIQLFNEITTSEDAAAEFVMGVMPKEAAEALAAHAAEEAKKKEVAATAETAAPPTPPTPPAAPVPPVPPTPPTG